MISKAGSDSADYQEPCSPSEVKFAEIVRADYAWSAIEDACIAKNNEAIFGQVMTIDDCKDKCISELGEDCKSIDYNPINYNCMISKAGSDSADYQKPCTVSEVKFTE